VTNLEKGKQKEDSEDEGISGPSGQILHKKALMASVKDQTAMGPGYAVKYLLFELFSREEVKRCSISGKKTIKCGDVGPRPPLDQKRFRILLEIVFDAFPTYTRKDIIERIQNIQKVLRKQ
jgi:hypothetical protein